MAHRGESAFRQELVRVMRKMGIFVTPVESGSTMNGIPDLNYCYACSCGWIELKYAPVPCASKAKLRFRPKQIPWMRDYAEHGGKVFVAVKYCDGYALYSIDAIEDSGHTDVTRGVYIPDLRNGNLSKWCAEL